MNNEERLNLKKLLSQNECEDNTEHIRKVRHSNRIRVDILKMQELKKKNARIRKNDSDRFSALCQSQCEFLFNNYMDIYNKVYKDELNLNIMSNLLNILQHIEDGNVDQHEGSVIVGKILKELYVDSALKRCNAINETIETPETVYADAKAISWRQYKEMNG
jgi:triphosphoribosyl-dephospho-CoA synthetase